MAPRDCPCGRGRYAACCGPLHEAVAAAAADASAGPAAGARAADAEALMRSRYSAYVLEDADYLLATWHPTTRPASVEFVPGLRWLGLEVKRHAADGDRAVVAFVARHRLGGGRAGRLHETSRFLREGGRWFYVDGDVDDR